MNRFEGKTFKSTREAMNAIRPHNHNFKCRGCGVELSACKYVVVPVDPKDFTGPKKVVEMKDEKRYCGKCFKA